MPGFARHFAFSETGQAGHTLRVCCFAPKIRCAHFGAPLANPAPSARLKNADFCANEWQICIFPYASLRWFRTSERQKLWHFSNAHETIRMTFVCSHPSDASKNDIGNRAGRDGVSGPHTGQHFAPRACGKALRRNNFPGNGRRAVGRPYFKFRFPAHAQRVSARMSFLLFRARRKTPPRLPLGFRGHRSDALKKHKFASCWRWNLCFLAERKAPALLCHFLGAQESGTLSFERET